MTCNNDTYDMLLKLVKNADERAQIPLRSHSGRQHQ